MILNRLTPAAHFKIKAPRWKDRSVGLQARLVSQHNIVEIMYERKSDGERIYPDPLYVSGDMVRGCEVDMQYGTALYMVPIEMLEPLERRE